MSYKAHPYLPPEIIRIIAENLAFAHPPTLFNLAKANKTYYICCRPFFRSILFHDVKIRVPSWPNSRDVERLVNNLIQKLKTTDGLCYVHQLFICKEERGLYEAEGEWTTPQLSDLQSTRYPDTYTTQYASWRNRPATEARPEWREYVYPHEHRFGPESIWESVVNLIKLLPGLTDLVWQYPEQFPHCVLKTLHQNLPKCRLHLHSFWLHSLVKPEATRFEQNILTSPSPSLYSVKMSELYGSKYNLSRRDRMLRALELAPNLKEIHLSGSIFGDPTCDGHNYPSRLAQLQVFQIDDDRFWSKAVNNFREWSRFIDFSTLKVLKIDSRIDDEAIRNWSAMDSAFPSLKSLALNLTCGQTLEYYEATSKLLQSLPSLDELELKGWHTIVYLFHRQASWAAVAQGQTYKPIALAIPKRRGDPRNWCPLSSPRRLDNHNRSHTR